MADITLSIAKKGWYAYCVKYLHITDKPTIAKHYATIAETLPDPLDIVMFCIKLHQAQPPQWEIALKYYAQSLTVAHDIENE